MASWRAGSATNMRKPPPPAPHDLAPGGAGVHGALVPVVDRARSMIVLASATLQLPALVAGFGRTRRRRGCRSRQLAASRRRSRACARAISACPRCSPSARSARSRRGADGRSRTDEERIEQAADCTVRKPLAARTVTASAGLEARSSSAHRTQPRTGPACRSAGRARRSRCGRPPRRAARRTPARRGRRAARSAARRRTRSTRPARSRPGGRRPC